MYMNPKLPKVKPVVYLPLELWLAIFQLCPADVLLNGRLVCKKWKSISNVVLSERLRSPIVDLSLKARQARLEYKALQVEREPQLEHYREFLTVPGGAEHLSEVLWYSNVPLEVQTVCECLVRLRGGVTLPGTERMQWADIKKSMKRSDFKLWLHCLSSNVEFISISDTRKVEQIIRVDPTITYERLRDVSMAGYRLLILVAASLQFSSISDEIGGLRLKSVILETTLKYTCQFMDSITLTLKE
jgi:hypothetical protein